MRLKEVESKLRNASNINGLLGLKTMNDGYKIDNLNGLKELIPHIENIPAYKNEIEEIKSSSIYRTTQDSLILNQEDALNLYNLSKHIAFSRSSLLLVFSNLLPPSEDNSISIKLPEPSDYESLIKTMSVFQKSMTPLVIHEDIGGCMKIKNWETGSFWIELVLGTPLAIAVISSLAWSAAVVSKKMTEGKLLEQQVRSLAIKNDSLEDILESQKKMTKTLTENEANSILTSHYKDHSPEHFERVRSTIKTFAQLIQDGAEINPSLVAPENVQNLFPDYKNIGLIESKIARLEKSPKDTSENEV